MVLELNKEELKRMKLVVEQIQENICMYVDETNLFNGFGIDDIKDGLCQVVVDTFKEAGA
jgi:hypothetical protein